MKNKKNKQIIIALVVLLAIALVFVVITLQGNKLATNDRQIAQKTYSDWTTSYKITDKNPLGLYHWNMLLNMHLDSNQQMVTVNNSDQFSQVVSPKKTNFRPTFMFIGKQFALLKEENEQLLQGVKNGANLFVACEYANSSFLNMLFDSVQMGFFYDTTITLTTATNSFPFVARFQDYTLAKSWWGYKKMWTNSNNKEVGTIHALSGMHHLTNSVELHYGNGKIYLNTIPELFTNYQMLSKSGYPYASLWLNKIPTNESVYWLQIAQHLPTKNTEDESTQAEMSFLIFIFDDRIRLISLLLCFLGIALFLLFRTKRTQAIIPIYAQKRNMTLFFARTISSIYFNQREPYTMVKIQRDNFFHIVQKQFNIDLLKDRSQKNITLLAQKTNINKEEIIDLIHLIDHFNNTNTSDANLIQLRKKTLHFYRKSGVIPARIRAKTTQNTTFHTQNAWLAGLFILLGLFFLSYGTFLLVKANSMGVVFWILGAISVILGVRKISHIEALNQRNEKKNER